MMDLEEKQENERLKHLEFIEASISRMNQCSFNLKGWAIGLTSALIGFFASNVNSLVLPIWLYAIIIVIPIMIFWWLDSFYLQQERKFRELYKDVAMLNSPRPIRAFDMPLAQYTSNKCSLIDNILSKTELGFYGSIVFLVVALTLLIICIKE